MDMPAIPFIDLAAQRRRIGPAVDKAMLAVANHGGYIMGPEVKELEAELAAFCGAKHVISCSNGTDALALVLMAKGVGVGDAVFCPTFTFAATAEIVAWVGATAVFVDVLPDNFNMDPKSLEAGIKVARGKRLNPVAIIPVDMFGQPAGYDEIETIANREGLWILSDAAQSFGASYKGRKVGTIGLATTTSFFPAKPLGCYGDGGAVFTENDELAAIMRSLRVHGQGSDKYDNVRIGMNGRLDTIQAAVLREKLKVFPDEIRSRDAVAERYSQRLPNRITVPKVDAGKTSVWAQYTIRLNGADRNAFCASLKQAGIPTAVYYPKSLHQQTAYKSAPTATPDLPNAESISQDVVSLPMHPYLTEEVQDRIIDEVRRALQ